MVRLTIRDHGRGFQPEVAMHGHGLGLISMRERASLVKGTILVTSKPGWGTEISMRIPISASRDRRGKTAGATRHVYLIPSDRASEERLVCLYCRTGRCPTAAKRRSARDVRCDGAGRERRWGQGVGADPDSCRALHAGLRSRDGPRGAESEWLSRIPSCAQESPRCGVCGAGRPENHDSVGAGHAIHDRPDDRRHHRQAGGVCRRRPGRQAARRLRGGGDPVEGRRRPDHRRSTTRTSCCA